MSTWIIGKRFDETSLPDKESFYSSLNMENIDDIDYRHDNNVFKMAWQVCLKNKCKIRIIN